MGKPRTMLFPKVFAENQLIPSTLGTRKLTYDFNCDRIKTPVFDLLQLKLHSLICY